MKSRTGWEIIMPAAFTLGVSGGLHMSPIPAAMRHGITVGLFIAMAQGYLSIFSMRQAWGKPFFYWVWGGGIIFRLLVFSATAFAVHKYTELNFAATMISLVTATTVFMVFESSKFKKKFK